MPPINRIRMDMEKPRRKKIRLDRSTYGIKGQAFSITICCQNRTQVFSSTEIAQKAVEILYEVANYLKIDIFAYCFMPDHVHLLASPSNKTDIIDFVKTFKGRVATALRKQGVSGSFWQESFYDHALRKDEDLKEVSLYILNNPVRAGLVEEWRDYKWLGSLVFDIKGL